MKTINILLRTHTENHLGHVYFSFYVGSERIHFSAKITVDPNDWNSRTCRVKTSDKNHKDKNLVIENILARINNVFVKYRLKDRKLTRDLFIKAYNRKDDYATFHEYADKKLVTFRSRMELGTYKNHVLCLRKVKEFDPSLSFDDIDHNWLDTYFCHLRKIGNNENTSYKNMTVLKKYILCAYREGYIELNPFQDWHIRKTTASCVYLTEDELGLLLTLYREGELEHKLHKTLEFFLFLCFSSLHVGDALLLKLEQFSEDSFVYYRQKLRNRKPEPILVPVSDPLRSIMCHICGTRKKGHVFENSYCEQAMNRMLKDIASIAGIQKNLTLKVGRHTFATIYLRKTKDLSSLKEILGHSDLHETMVYAHVLDESKQEGIRCFNSFEI